MGKVIYATSLSLDGYIASNGGDLSWHIIDEEMHRHFNDLESAIDINLYGRHMYELMSAFWPTADENPSAPSYVIEYARIWKKASKVVFSKTLDRVDWNSRLVRGDAVEEVARLKQQPGKSMGVGGSELALTLAEAGLIDEYRLYFVPIFLGSGKPMFTQLRERIKLELIEVRRFNSGTVLLHYQQIDPVQ